MSKPSFSQLINFKKPKYDVIKDQFQAIIAEGQYEQVQVFIDLDVIIASYFNPVLFDKADFDQEFFKGVDPLIGEITSFVTYIRHLFASRFQVYSRFVFYTTTIPDFSYAGGFKEDFFRKRGFASDSDPEAIRRNLVLRDAVTNAIEVAKFLPSVSIIDSKGLNPEVIPRVIMNDVDDPEGYKNLNVIISDSKSAFQLMNEDTVVFRLAGEKSVITHPGNLASHFSSVPAQQRRFTSNPADIARILSLVGYSKLSVKKAAATTAITVGKKFAGGESVEDAYLTKMSDEAVEQYNFNFNALNAFGTISRAQQLDITNQSESLVDHNGIRKYLASKCEKFAVNTEWLYEGEHS